MDILIAVDKFKGSLSTFEAGTALREGLAQAVPKAKIHFFPMADGGDGFCKVVKHYLNTKTIRLNTTDPLFRKIKGYYEWEPRRKTAIIEMASSSGITLLQKNERNPLKTSSYGTGLLIRHALQKGARKIILGLGGSATNDGGMGIAAALGFQFQDKGRRPLAPIGASLDKVCYIIPPNKIPKAEWVICCDVENPLVGEKGAAHMYARQKGAGPASVTRLDKGLRNLARILKEQKKISLEKVKGAGAAGGVPALLLAYFNCTLTKGAAYIITESKLEAALKKSDWVITGEGKIDEQSFHGKLIDAIVSLADRHHKKILLVCGSLDAAAPLTTRAIKNRPLLSLVTPGISEQKARQKARQLLSAAVYRFFKLY